MLENLMQKNCLAGSDAIIAWLESEIQRDIKDGVW